MAGLVALTLGSAAVLPGCEDRDDITASVVALGGPGAGGPADPIAELFVRHCAACHGESGHGDGPAAEQLYPKPRAFPDSPFRFAATGGTEAQMLTAIRRMIADGVERSAMPGFKGVLTEPEIEGLTRYVAKLSADTSRTPARPLETIKRAPEFTKAMVQDGFRLYHQMACVNCHGESGHGDGPAMAGLVDSRNQPVRPADLASGFYKSGPRAEDLYRTIVEGVPGTPMIGYGGMLIRSTPGGQAEDRNVWALVAYIKSLAPLPVLDAAASGAEIRLVDAPVPEMLTDSTHAAWLRVPPVKVMVRPLWQRVGWAAALRVSAVRADGRIALRLEWDDSTPDTNHDSGVFPDAVAIMFALGEEVPALPMGVELEGHGPSAPVNIWNWKASRQYDASTGVRHDADDPRVVKADEALVLGRPEAIPVANEARATVRDQDLHLNDPLFRAATAAGNIHADPGLVEHAVLEANAEGFGTLTYQAGTEQDVRSTAVWGGGHWFVTTYRQATNGQSLDIQFTPGRRIALSFAVWDGSRGDRDGIKLVSGWHWLVIER